MRQEPELAEVYPEYRDSEVGGGAHARENCSVAADDAANVCALKSGVRHGEIAAYFHIHSGAARRAREPVRYPLRLGLGPVYDEKNFSHFGILSANGYFLQLFLLRAENQEPASTGYTALKNAIPARHETDDAASTPSAHPAEWRL